MTDRKDPLTAAAAIACNVEKLAAESSSDARGTVGYIHTEPAEHNIVPGLAEIPVDYRVADTKEWQSFFDDLMAYTERICRQRGLTYELKTTLSEPPAHCSTHLQSLIDEAATEYGVDHTSMISFPCHDALHMARIMPMGMVFLRSGNGGVSHCPDEFTSKEDLECGANTLLGTLRKLCADSE